MKRKPVIGITMGDPAGIGPEIILKALWGGKLYSYGYPLVIGDARVLEEARKIISSSIKVSSLRDMELMEFREDRVEVLDLGVMEGANFSRGRVNPLCGKASVEYIKKAVSLAQEGKISAVVTAPLNKQALYQGGFRYPGHTELLAELTGCERYAMALVRGRMRVVLVTAHIPLSEVKGKITRERVREVILLVHNSGSLFNCPHPRIGVAGLNPHAGEGGVLGKEEILEIIPAIKEAQKSGIRVEGPFPPDTFFLKSRREKFDFLVAMYHDQGLIPLKLRGFGRSVNLTLGLPLIRTSVDHGTAYDIAGKGVADPTSLIEAFKLASHLARRKLRMG